MDFIPEDSSQVIPGIMAVGDLTRIILFETFLKDTLFQWGCLEKEARIKIRNYKRNDRISGRREIQSNATKYLATFTSKHFEECVAYTFYLMGPQFNFTAHDKWIVANIKLNYKANSLAHKLQASHQGVPFIEIASAKAPLTKFKPHTIIL